MIDKYSEWRTILGTESHRSTDRSRGRHGPAQPERDAADPSLRVPELPREDDPRELADRARRVRARSPWPGQGPLHRHHARRPDHLSRVPQRTLGQEPDRPHHRHELGHDRRADRRGSDPGGGASHGGGDPETLRGARDQQHAGVVPLQPEPATVPRRPRGALPRRAAGDQGAAQGGLPDAQHRARWQRHLRQRSLRRDPEAPPARRLVSRADALGLSDARTLGRRRRGARPARRTGDGGEARPLDQTPHRGRQRIRARACDALLQPPGSRERLHHRLPAGDRARAHEPRSRVRGGSRHSRGAPQPHDPLPCIPTHLLPFLHEQHGDGRRSAPDPGESARGRPR